MIAGNHEDEARILPPLVYLTLSVRDELGTV